MPNDFMKNALPKLLSVAAAALIMVQIFLLRQNSIYKSENRRLMIMNDSVMSANLELNARLNKDSSAPKLLSTSKKLK
jgi:hypothetical protein